MPLKPLDVRSRALSHVGAVRKVNEDAYLDCPARGIWAIADGLGGHAAGEIASRTVVQSLQALSLEADLGICIEVIEAALLQANRRLRDSAGRNDQHTIASTVAILVTRARHAACLWAGDSRIYRLRGHRLAQLTQDHAVVEDLVVRGALARKAARAHPSSHLITRAIGAAPRLNLDIELCDIHPNDVFILCSDGLYKELREREIEATFTAGVDGVSKALDVALTRGARDNVTVVGVHFLA